MLSSTPTSLARWSRTYIYCSPCRWHSTPCGCWHPPGSLVLTISLLSHTSFMFSSAAQFYIIYSMNTLGIMTHIAGLNIHLKFLVSFVTKNLICSALLDLKFFLTRACLCTHWRLYRLTDWWEERGGMGVNLPKPLNTFRDDLSVRHRRIYVIVTLWLKYTFNFDVYSYVGALQNL